MKKEIQMKVKVIEKQAAAAVSTSIQSPASRHLAAGASRPALAKANLIAGKFLWIAMLGLIIAALSQPTQASSWTEGAKTVLFIRVDFTDRLGDPVSVATAENLINNQVNNAYIENSYGKTSLAVTVTPTLHLAHPSTYYTALDANGNDNATQLLADARAAALTAGYNTNSYDRDIAGFVTIFSWGGLGYVGDKGTWINGYFDFRVAAHELGHNEGLWHANLWNTTDGSIIGAGTNDEYADPFDIMGANWNNSQQLHFNTWFKNRLDWLKDTGVKNVTASGTYRISAEDTTDGSGARALRIAKDGEKSYWVEYRQKITGNSWLATGAVVHWGFSYNTGSQLLDMTPGSANGNSDSPLALGQTFTDSEAGLSITPIAVGGSAPKWMDVQVSVNIPPANNDNFGSAQAISNMSGATAGTNSNATAESGEPTQHGPFHSVWYNWTAPATGTAKIDTFGSDYDTVLAVYTGSSVAGLTNITSNDDSGGGLQSAVSFAATAGTTYCIAVDGNSGATGTIALNWTSVNDNFVNSTLLSGGSGTVTGTNSGATTEYGEPAHVYGPARSLWYSWTAPTSGTAKIDTFNSDFDTLLAVYTGSNVAGLTSIASNDDSPINVQSALSFAAAAGTTYRIAVDGFNAATGNLALHYTYVAPPTFTGFTPAYGPVGTVVTLVGTDFSNPVTVTFNGVTATAVTFVSDAQIKATVPTGATTGLISITTGGLTLNSATAFKVTPKITSFTPASGPAGTSVVVTGLTFNGATTVRFNGKSALYTLDSSTQITATVPANAVTGKISVTTPAGTATSAATFTVTSPAISSFTPASGVVGSTVTINGALFSNPTTVKFNGVTAPSVTFVSASKLTAVVPADATTGPISIVTVSSQTATSAASFKVVPQLTSFTPSGGPVNTYVFLTGTGLSGTTAVKFGTLTAPFYVNTSTQVSTAVPANATTNKISITTTGGTATSATAFVVDPRVTNFSPTSAAVGATVTINGANFINPMTVKFNGVAAPSVTFVTTAKLTAIVPGGATTGPISVFTAGGQTASSATSFKVLPVLSSFSPSSGPVGSVVTVTGTGFTGATAVKFGTLSAPTFTVNSPTQITVTVPAGAVTSKISVSTPGGTATSATIFSVTSGIGAPMSAASGGPNSSPRF